MKLLKTSLLLACLITLLQAFITAESDAQICTMGFPTTVPDCSADNCVTKEGNTIIIPDMRFTCSGMITGWRAAGELRLASRSRNSSLIIWRERRSEPGIYVGLDRIQLGNCGSELPMMEINNVYECDLPQSDRVSVESGYIIGIETPGQDTANFRIYFNSSGGPINYIFNHRSNRVMNLDNSTELVQLVPQISLTVERTSTTQIPMTELTDGSTITSGPTPTEAESITTSDHTTELTDGGTITSGPTSTEAESITTSNHTTELTESSTIASGPSSTEARSIGTSDHTTVQVTPKDFITTSSPRLGDSANNPQDKDNSDVSIAIVGAIVGVLLVFISVLLLALILRRQGSGQKSSPANNNNNVTNPVYNGNVEVYEPDTGPVGVCTTVDYNLDMREYEDIDNPRPNHISQPSDLRIKDYSQPRDALIHAGYEIPPWNLVPPVPLAVPHSEIETLYVPTQEQRKTLPINGAIYAAIKKAQQYESGPVPELFEEEETYWEPAVDTPGLIRQLSSKKYREILRPRLQTVGHLGSGQFGTVSKGIWQSPMGAMDVAVKQLQPGASEEEKVKFLQEAAINGQFRHPNVAKLMGVVTIGEPAMIVLELLTNGDLHKYLLNLRPSPGEILPSNMPQLLLKFCQQIASGMEHLAGKSFVHRDLAARNILVSEGKICKISDFGMSRNIMNEDYYISHGGRVPVKWTAPEAINFKKYSTASDVWSFGCVVYEIWSLGQKPFQDYRNLEVVRMIDDGYRLPPPPGLTKELYKIMIQCWHPDRSSRPTFPQLVEMLSRADFELFVWEEEDLRNSDPQVKLIGAPLEVAKNLYHQLQRVYFSS